MFGFRFVKFDPTQHVILYRNGDVVKEGPGLAFWYFAPSSTIISIPLGSFDSPFIFEETTSDFQEVTVQGQVTFRITDPKKAAALLNYSLDSRGNHYVSTDPEKLPQRVINAINVLTRSRIQALSLREVIVASESLVNGIEKELSSRTEIQSAGLGILGLSILAIKPTPDTARALETETREQLLKEADDAVYLRRNSAVEQERLIKENELETERAIQKRRQSLESAETTHQIQLEDKRKELVKLETDNSKIEAESRSFALQCVVKAISEADPKVIQSLAGIGMQPDKLIAAAMNELAMNADKIGELNIAPDMLRDLVRSGRGRQKPAAQQ
ncbi:MAG: SPFH domain-containing protein [Verrucomicrobiales bacterium]|nr:SPFH domain-containing protein [Verrucomicrobiales bacterium]